MPGSVNATITINGPVLNVPPLQSVDEDVPLAFSAANGNSITISDSSVGGGTVTLGLTAVNGTVTLASTVGISIISRGQNTLTISGTVADVNAALDGLVFVRAPHFSGTASFGIVLADGQNQVSDGISIVINRVAHTPTVTDAATLEDQQTATGPVIGVNPLDASAGIYFKITAITGGTLFQDDGVTPINNGDFITSAQGSAGLKFTPATGFYGDASFNVQTSLSPSNGGLGGNVVTSTIRVDAPGHHARHELTGVHRRPGADGH